MSRPTELRLLDVLDAIDRIVSYSENMDYEGFLADRRTQDAIARNIEIIGEAIGSLPEAFRAQHPNVPWSDIVGMRNTIIHKYFGILPDIVWDVVQTELPILERQVREWLDELKD